MMITMETCEAGMWENKGSLCSMNTWSLVIRLGRECFKDILESGYQRSPICIIAGVTLLVDKQFIEFPIGRGSTDTRDLWEMGLDL